MKRKTINSGIPWIGEIPEGWGVHRIKHHFSVISGATPKSENMAYWDGDIPWITPADFKTEDKYVSKGRRNLTEEGYASCGTTIIPKGSIVFSKRAPVGSVAISTNKLCTNQGCLSCVAKDGSNVEYFYFLMSVLTEQFGLVSTGTTFKEIALDVFCNFELPYPSEQEQNSIVSFLNTECARIDAVIEKTRASIEEYKKLKQAVITEAVTKGIRSGRKMKDSGIEWIGEIPEEWGTYRIANLYDERNESGNDSLPILSISINTGISDREIPEVEQSRVFVRSEDKSKYIKVLPGDLAYNMMRAWQGAFGAVRVAGMVSPAYVVAKPKKADMLDSRYIEAILRTPMAIEEMHRYSKGITDFRLRLYWPEFKNIRICVPSIEEQKEIADYIDTRSGEYDALIEAKERVVDELEKYKKSVIYEYVTGKKEVL